MRKSITILSFALLVGGSVWGQSPARNMVTEGLIAGMEASIGDLDFNQEDQFINAFNKYVKDSRQASAANKQQVLVTYQNTVKQIVTPQKYAILLQDPNMQSRPLAKNAAAQH